MTTVGSTADRRILVVDDNPAIHEDFRRILQQEERSFPSSHHTLSEHRQRSRILLAEDNPDNQQILIRLLEKLWIHHHYSE